MTEPAQSKADRCFQEARHQAEQGSLHGCMNALRECLRHNRNHIHANAHLAWLLSQQGEYREAYPLYFRLHLLRPWSLEIHLRSWQCLQFGCRKWIGKQSETNRFWKWMKDQSEKLCGSFSLILTYFIEIFIHDGHIVSYWMRINRELKKLATVNAYEYYKVSEMDFVISRLSRMSCHTVLDLGSGCSAIPSYIAMQGKQVIAAELDETALQTQHELSTRQPHLSLHVTAANFLRLPFADETFDAITIISTIEHVPNDGDIQTMKELRRVLKPGGALFITVPVSHIANEQHTTHSIGHVYQECTGEGPGYLRVYNPEWIHQRLIEPSGLSRIELIYKGETNRWGWMGFGRNFIDHNHIIHPSAYAAPLNLLFTREFTEHELPNAHWAVACIQLQKAAKY